jgi:hypothetical protein
MLVTYIKSKKDGREVPFLFSNGVSAKLAMECEVPVNKVGEFFGGMQSWPVGQLWKFYFLAAREGAKTDKVRFDMDYDDFVSWIFADDEILPKIVEAMIMSNPEPEKKTVNPVAKKGR